MMSSMDDLVPKLLFPKALLIQISIITKATLDFSVNKDDG